MWLVTRLSAAVVAAVAFVFPGLGAATHPAPAPAAPAATVAAPTSMAALGDSITRGFDACGFYVDCGSHSWSIGTDDRVDSQAERLTRQQPALAAHVYSDAKDGARAVDLAGQARTAVAQHAGFVTVLIGANDVCRPDPTTMTDTRAFRTQVDTALRILTTGLPDTRVFVASIPDLGRLWQVGHTNIAARAVWRLGHICPSLLAGPTSTSAADTARRAAVVQRVSDLNQQLAAACAAQRHCRWDGGAVSRYPFTLHQLSKFDFFHPNVYGQRALADVTWRAGYTW